MAQSSVKTREAIEALAVEDPYGYGTTNTGWYWTHTGSGFSLEDEDEADGEETWVSSSLSKQPLNGQAMNEAQMEESPHGLSPWPSRRDKRGSAPAPAPGGQRGRGGKSEAFRKEPESESKPDFESYSTGGETGKQNSWFSNFSKYKFIAKIAVITIVILL